MPPRAAGEQLGALGGLTGLAAGDRRSSQNPRGVPEGYRLAESIGLVACENDLGTAERCVIVTLRCCKPYEARAVEVAMIADCVPSPSERPQAETTCRRHCLHVESAKKRFLTLRATAFSAAHR
jgi:hypothetical protein